MSRRVQRPPIHGRGYSVRGLMSVGGGRMPLAPPPRPPPSPPRPSASPPRPPASPPRPPRPPSADAVAPATARCCSIGAATRALATSVRSPIWLCHQPLHAIAPCQKFVYVEL